MPQIMQLLTADGEDFVTRPVHRLVLTWAGIDGDRHAGPLRAADARTPWHRRGTEIANTRQLSIVSYEECAEIAALLGIDQIDPALLGANLMVRGLPALSLLMPASRLQFSSGATIFVTEQNAPCRHPADRLAQTHGTPSLSTRFARAAIGRRGLVGLVERPGELAVGDTVSCIASPAQVVAPRLPALA